ncbi:MAG: hypothetical protein IT236_02240 [Bacteroidia bacterium]|nr:hypothetical protein [Bacteroidia bacterium]
MFLKKLFIITVLFVYLFSATEFRELLKFPEMIEHYHEHKEKNHLISFFDFLDMHYSNTQDDDGDADRDMKLPFKSHNNCASVSNNLFTGSVHQAYAFHPLETKTKTYSLPQLQFIPSSFQVSIWQPPKA